MGCGQGGGWLGEWGWVSWGWAGVVCVWTVGVGMCGGLVWFGGGGWLVGWLVGGGGWCVGAGWALPRPRDQGQRGARAGPPPSASVMLAPLALDATDAEGDGAARAVSGPLCVVTEFLIGRSS